MEAIKGMVRGMKAIDQGGPISVPVGRGTLGRVMNAPVNLWTSWGRSSNNEDHADPRPAPLFEDQATTAEMFETGVKVVDSFSLSSRVARLDCSGAPVSAKTVYSGVDQQRRQATRRIFRVRRRRRTDALKAICWK
jgi:F-type H+-transporting ATPase subunit beta